MGRIIILLEKNIEIKPASRLSSPTMSQPSLENFQGILNKLERVEKCKQTFMSRSEY